MTYNVRGNLNFRIKVEVWGMNPFYDGKPFIYILMQYYGIWRIYVGLTMSPLLESLISFNPDEMIDALLKPRTGHQKIR